MRKFAATLCAALALAAAGNSDPTGTNDLPDWFYKPIGRVGDIGRVGPISGIGNPGKDDFDVQLPEGLRGAPNGYIVCWTWNVTKEPAWRCTSQTVENPREATEFAYYQKEKYVKNGDAFVLPVIKKEWGDADLRKNIMDRVKAEILPAFLELAARRRESTNAELAGRVRKQIEFVRPDWVDVKPALAKDGPEYKELRAGEIAATKDGGYQDGFVEGPGGLAGTYWDVTYFNGIDTTTYFEFREKGIFRYGKDYPGYGSSRATRSA